VAVLPEQAEEQPALAVVPLQEVSSGTESGAVSRLAQADQRRVALQQRVALSGQVALQRQVLEEAQQVPPRAHCLISLTQVVSQIWE